MTTGSYPSTWLQKKPGADLDPQIITVLSGIAKMMPEYQYGQPNQTVFDVETFYVAEFDRLVDTGVVVDNGFGRLILMIMDPAKCAADRANEILNNRKARALADEIVFESFDKEETTPTLWGSTKQGATTTFTAPPGDAVAFTDSPAWVKPYTVRTCYLCTNDTVNQGAVPMCNACKVGLLVGE